MRSDRSTLIPIGQKAAFSILVSIFFAANATGVSAESPSPKYSDLKKRVIETVGILTESAALFNVCADPKTTSPIRYLRWTAHELELGNVVEELARHFSDENLTFAFQMGSLSISDQADFQRSAKKQCSTKDLKEAAIYVEDAWINAERLTEFRPDLYF